MAEPRQVDVLSDLLRAVRLRGAIYFDFELSDPWVAAAPESRELAPLLMPGAQHVIEYHVLSEGRCWAALHGGAPVQMQPGDVVAFPHGSSHVLSSTPGQRGKPQMELFTRAYTAGRLPYVVSGEGPGRTDARVVCGFLGCDVLPFNPLIGALPAMIHVPAAAAGAGDWLGSFLAMTLAESKGQRAGSQNMLGRLGELMFVEILRRHLESLPSEQTGWLAGVRDRYVGRALALLHGSPARAWTLEQLASEVALSRSAFAERFSLFVGQPPMQYLAHWRMQLASEMLLGTNAGVAAVAADVGYESEEAFGRAFKRLVGDSPAAWRRRRRREEVERIQETRSIGSDESGRPM
jgi:AraC-like DNA-binding protein